MAWSLRGDFMKDRTVLIICGIAIIVSALFAAYIINDTLSISTTELEDRLIETSAGEKYVLGGDGYYTYAGTDSNGNYKIGTYMGKY